MRENSSHSTEGIEQFARDNGATGEFSLTVRRGPDGDYDMFVVMNPDSGDQYAVRYLGLLGAHEKCAVTPLDALLHAVDVACQQYDVVEVIG